MTEIFFAACVILFPLLTLWKRFNVAFAFVLVAIIYAAFGAAIFAYAIVIQSASSNGIESAADTYYVVSKGPYYLNIAVFMLLPALLFWIQHKLNPSVFHRSKLVLFWLMNIGILIEFPLRSLLFTLAMPRRYTDYEDAFTLIHLISVWATLIARLSMLGILVLLCVTLFLRMKKTLPQ